MDNLLQIEIATYFSVRKSDKILIMVDECHRWWGKKNEALLWFLSYHRHMFVDITLITQSHKMLHTDYYIINDVRVILKPYQQFIKSRIRYSKYIGCPPSSGNFLENDYIKKRDLIFNLYTSGDSVKSESFLIRYIFLLLLLVGAVVALFSHFVPDSPPSSPIGSSSIQKSEQYIKSNPTTSVNSSPTPVRSSSYSIPKDSISNYSYSKFDLYTEIHIIDETFSILNTNIVNFDMKVFENMKYLLEYKVVGVSIYKDDVAVRKVYYVVFDSRRLEMFRNFYEESTLTIKGNNDVIDNSDSHNSEQNKR